MTVTIEAAIQQRIDALASEILALGGERKAAEALAEESDVFRLQIIALKHKKSGLEEALGIVKAKGIIGASPEDS